MKLVPITACLYPSTSRIHMLASSCHRQGFSVIPHGVGQVFAGWARCLMEHTIPHMEQLALDGATHALFMDGIDSLVVGPLGEIAAKYERMGSPPCLMSADSDIPIENAGAFKGPGPWRYLNGGGYIAAIPYFIESMEMLSREYPNEGNHQVWLEKNYYSGGGLKLDHDCEIFQSMDGNQSIRAIGGRVANTLTGTWPCVLHFRGGYCDPVRGREDRMKPWFDAVYGSAQ